METRLCPGCGKAVIYARTVNSTVLSPFEQVEVFAIDDLGDESKMCDVATPVESFDVPRYIAHLCGGAK